jgi:hypothetical protein
MSMIKLLQRVVTPEDIDEEGERSTQDGYTYGIIASDPLTQFSVVFSALIHDGERFVFVAGDRECESPTT